MTRNLPAADPLQWVICLCADWCGVCRDYRPVFDELAALRPELRFVWVDIEDDADLLGEAEVETFPTLVLAGATSVRFSGALAPHTSALSRLIDALQGDASAGGGTPHGPDFSALLLAIKQR